MKTILRPLERKYLLLYLLSYALPLAYPFINFGMRSLHAAVINDPEELLAYSEAIRPLLGLMIQLPSSVILGLWLSKRARDGSESRGLWFSVGAILGLSGLLLRLVVEVHQNLKTSDQEQSNPRG